MKLRALQPGRIKLPRLKGIAVAFITGNSEPRFLPLETELPTPPHFC